MKQLLILFLIFYSFSCINANPPQPNKTESRFSFAFFTDLHLNNGNNNCWQGFDKAVSNAKTKGVDFIMTGGDNVDIDGMDSVQLAHELYQKYALKIENAGIPSTPPSETTTDFGLLKKTIHFTKKDYLKSTSMKQPILSVTKVGILLC